MHKHFLRGASFIAFYSITRICVYFPQSVFFFLQEMEQFIRASMAQNITREMVGFSQEAWETALTLL